MNEFELIQHFFTRSACAQGGENISLGIGDDCALLQIPAGQSCAVSTDTLVSGIHFPDNAPAFLLGQRALAVAVSDLAAMGATPIGFTLAITLPQIDADWLQAFSAGLSAMAFSGWRYYAWSPSYWRDSDGCCAAAASVITFGRAGR